MPRKLFHADTEVSDRADRIIGQHYAELRRAGLAIDFLMATSDKPETPPVVLHGRRCAAICRIVPYRERVKGGGDAEITIDHEAYHDLGPRERDALLDHEIHHILLDYDQDGAVKHDACDRPKLTLKKHDVEFGWFLEIAQRYGADSCEQRQARIVWDNYGQSLMPFLEESFSKAYGDPKSPLGRSTVTITAGDKSVTLPTADLAKIGRTSTPKKAAKKRA